MERAESRLNLIAKQLYPNNLYDVSNTEDDIKSERKSASFNYEELHQAIYGPERANNMVRLNLVNCQKIAYQMILRDPELYSYKQSEYDLELKESRAQYLYRNNARIMRMIRRYLQLRNAIDNPDLKKALHDALWFPYLPNF